MCTYIPIYTYVYTYIHSYKYMHWTHMYINIYPINRYHISVYSTILRISNSMTLAHNKLPNWQRDDTVEHGIPVSSTAKLLAFFRMSPKGEHADSLASGWVSGAFWKETETPKKRGNVWNFHWKNEFRFRIHEVSTKLTLAFFLRKVVGIFACPPVLGNTFGQKSWTLNAQCPMTHRHQEASAVSAEADKAEKLVET